ncbi:uncharacterized protein METZ01_LOCUS93197 [marine metagenome]|uniref:Uncharacterized protein n=1 Tax=marine metagenome TaxID=408172 RepID=A0A381VLL3_9ZZZZ
MESKFAQAGPIRWVATTMGNFSNMAWSLDLQV